MVHLTASVLSEIKSHLNAQYDINGEFVFATNSDKGIVAVVIEDSCHPQTGNVVIPHLVIWNGKKLDVNGRPHLPETIDEMVKLAKEIA